MIEANESWEAIVVRIVERELGSAVERIEPLASGLGLRRFYRVTTAGEPRSVIARVDAREDPAGRPSGAPPEPALEPLRRFLEEQGLPVPARLGGDPQRGVELLEDLGSRTLESAVAGTSPRERMALYAAAIDLIPRLQGLEDPAEGLPAFRRRLDGAIFGYKAELFVRWSLPMALRREPRASEVEAVQSAFRWIAAEALAAPLRLAHRDYQSQNLHLCSDGRGGERLVMIDIQAPSWRRRNTISSASSGTPTSSCPRRRCAGISTGFARRFPIDPMAKASPGASTCSP